MSAPDQTLAERYGTRSRSRRPLVVAAVVLLALVFLGWVAWVGWYHANPKASSELESFEVVSEHEVRADVRVWLDEDALDGEKASCTVRALAFDHTVVGELAFTPRDGRNELSIRTDRRASAVESVGCTAPGQDRAR